MCILYLKKEKKMETIYIVYLVVSLLVLPVIIWGVVTQVQVNSTFNNYSNIIAKNNITADAVCKLMLEKHGITNISLTTSRGSLSDHFDPRKKTIALSESVFGSTSIAAIGVAAHECGHAIQHHENYVFLKIRAFFVPIVNFLSSVFFPLVILGIVFSALSYAFGIVFLYIAIAFYAASTLFYLVTLPVEFNASNRAIRDLKEMGILDEEELKGAKAVLRAAAMTYVVTFLTSLLYLLRYALWAIMIFGNRRD